MGRCKRKYLLADISYFSIKQKVSGVARGSIFVGFGKER